MIGLARILRILMLNVIQERTLIANSRRLVSLSSEINIRKSHHKTRDLSCADANSEDKPKS
jgi:hypothetical protein